MQFNYSKLRGRIIECYGSCANFAEALGIKPTTLSMKLHNRLEFKQSEIDCARDLLGIGERELGSYFFTR